MLHFSLRRRHSRQLVIMRFLLLMRGTDPDEAGGAWVLCTDDLGGEVEFLPWTWPGEEAGEAVAAL